MQNSDRKETRDRAVTYWLVSDSELRLPYNSRTCKKKPSLIPPQVFARALGSNEMPVVSTKARN